MIPYLAPSLLLGVEQAVAPIRMALLAALAGALAGACRPAQVVLAIRLLRLRRKGQQEAMVHHLRQIMRQAAAAVHLLLVETGLEQQEATEAQARHRPFLAVQ